MARNVIMAQQVQNPQGRLSETAGWEFSGRNWSFSSLGEILLTQENMKSLLKPFNWLDQSNLKDSLFYLKPIQILITYTKYLYSNI